jgi:hypothetical protein
MFRWFFSVWYAYRRQRDLKIMWPACKAQTKSIESAKDLFALHTHHDPAWLDLDRDHLHQIFEALE